MLTDTKKFCFSPPAQREEIREPHRTNSTSRKNAQAITPIPFCGKSCFFANAPQEI